MPVGSGVDTQADRQRRYRAGATGQTWWREYRLRPDVKAARKVSDAKRRATAFAVLHEAKAAPCADCGVNYPPYVMDFDHVRGIKCFNLSKAYNYPMSAIIAEMAKCDVVCSNCHRERTHARLG